MKRSLLWCWALGALVLSFTSSGYAQSSVSGAVTRKCAVEGGMCKAVSYPALVMFASAKRQSAMRTVSDPIACTDAVWGDVDPGSAKACYTVVYDVTYGVVAVEGGTTHITGKRTMRFGTAAGNRWVARTVGGNVQCTAAFFGSDPAQGAPKVCEVASPPTPIPPVLTPVGMPGMPGMDDMPKVDLSSIAPTAIGADYLHLLPTTEVAPPAGGDFRTLCTFSHMLFDDPLVFPGQVGMSHLHSFFGNGDTSATTTATSLRTTGSSTCRGGIANRSGYWVPTMIDTTDGTPLVPLYLEVYYKNGRTDGRKTASLPKGLRMIAGNHAATTPGTDYRFKCIGGPNNENDKYGPSIPNCDVGATMWQEIFFSPCWNGKDLDTPDHKSHMSDEVYQDGVGWTCPASHPVAIPTITFNVVYQVFRKNAPLKWRLASDNYSASLPAGYSSHGDWFNGWDSSISDTWGADCLRALKDCHGHLLGDGRMMY